MTLLDEYLPVYDVSDSVATIVDADVSSTWHAVMDVDLVEVGRKKPLVAVLGAVRVIPDLIAGLMRGKWPTGTPAQLRLRDMGSTPLADGGWVLLGERAEDEIALGLVGRFWQPVIEFAAVSRGDFMAFDTPGFAKTIYSLSVRPVSVSRTLLTGTMRTATTSADARRWFRRYWTLGVGSGAHLLVNGLLEVVRVDAERRASILPPGAAPFFHAEAMRG